MRCARYVVEFDFAHPNFFYRYEIRLAEGDLLTREVHTSHSFDITEFRELDGRFHSDTEVFESREAAESMAKSRVADSKRRLEEILALFETGGDD